MKKVKALIDCNGVGYEHFKKDEVRDLPEELANVLINYSYAEELTAEVVD